MFRGHTFYGHRNAALETQERTPWVAPDDAEGSDVDVSPLDVDSDDDDPSYVPDDEGLTLEDAFDPPNARGRRVNVVVPQEMPVEEEGEGEVNPKRPRVGEWKKDDIDIQPLPDFIHPQPDFLREPYEYFSQFFTAELRDHIVFQSNLYSRQKDVGSNFHISEEDVMVFLGLIIYMGLVPLPSIVDFWAVKTRIPQVADFMSRNRFKAIRSSLHFNDNDQAAGSQDRFFKVRVPFSKVTREFLKVPETPIHSIDEVMVAYKGTRAGNLRQYVAKKPDKWGYKLFCRSSVDGFVHDILMYQGETTFVSHPTQLSEEENAMSVTSKFVVSLVKTIKDPSHAAVYADNYFTSIGLAKYLRSKYGCRYVGTARENRVGHPPLKSVKEMSKKTTQRGTLNYVSSDGILVARWKDNSVVTILSTDVGVNPMGTVERYDRAQKKKVPIPCPSAIQMYNNRMGGIDKSDMLTHLYKTPFRAKRYYMRLFAYLLDLIICNAWILYKRDCLALQTNPKPLKDFRLDISNWLRSFKTSNFRITRNSLGTRDVPLPKRGQRAVLPSIESRQDATALHMPKHVTMRQTCKFCSTAGHIHRSRWMCEECKVALCLTENRNCFALFHKISK
ncbi:piggyBac transposable element-derived protein 3-like [Palaemon carinicauda]|uniref:piggyBac transposable element-derived protein 3-like n=1 Tax=Palaemon carinicauda TaxID=392227 RepID=UPI0035B5EF6D